MGELDYPEAQHIYPVAHLKCHLFTYNVRDSRQEGTNANTEMNTMCYLPP